MTRLCIKLVLIVIKFSQRLLLADSQARDLHCGNLNVLSVPGGRILDAYKFVLEIGKYELIAIFIEGNNIFDQELPSTVSPGKAANDLIDLTNFVTAREKES